MVNPSFRTAITATQQQQHHQPRLQIRRLYGLLKERIAKKRLEFQHTTFDPQKLWKIANEVEALNWVLQKSKLKVMWKGACQKICLTGSFFSYKKNYPGHRGIYVD